MMKEIIIILFVIWLIIGLTKLIIFYLHVPMIFSSHVIIFKKKKLFSALEMILAILLLSPVIIISVPYLLFEERNNFFLLSFGDNQEFVDHCVDDFDHISNSFIGMLIMCYFTI